MSQSRPSVGYFDGLCEPFNPRGIATFGYIYLNGDKTVKGYGLASEPWSKESTNNRAEYMGLICLMRSLLDKGIRDVIIRGDSQLVIKQMKGEYKVKSPNVIGLHAEAQELMKSFHSIILEWVPREQNSEADKLSRIAYDSVKNGKIRETGCGGRVEIIEKSLSGYR